MQHLIKFKSGDRIRYTKYDTHDFNCDGKIKKLHLGKGYHYVSDPYPSYVVEPDHRKTDFPYIVSQRDIKNLPPQITIHIKNHDGNIVDKTVDYNIDSTTLMYKIAIITVM